MGSRSMMALTVLAVGAIALGGCYSRSAAKARAEARAAVGSADAPALAPATAAEGMAPMGEATPAAAPAAAEVKAMSGRYGRPGFAVYEDDGRLWVFKMDSKAHDTFRAKGEPAQSVTRIGVGPDRMSVRGADGEVIQSYVDAVKYGKPGFAVFGDEGRLWVFRTGSEALTTYLETGEPAKSVTKIGVGPDRKTIRSADAETIEAYLRAGR